MASPTKPEDSQAGFEVGATGDDLRYWVAKEALRQGELRIASQISTADLMMSRATSIFGWSVTTTIALAGIGRVLPTGLRLPALAMFLSTFVAAVSCVWALWPRGWFISGCDPVQIMQMREDKNDEKKLDSELEILESLAQGLSKACESNSLAKSRFGKRLRIAWLLFCLSPVIGLVVAVLQTVLPFSWPSL